MPTKTFYHLPREKQKRLLAAAKKEFSRVPLKEASIANIVKLAGIPRGSFYQYFENKEDLYFYYFDTLRKSNERDIIRYIQEAEGDLLEGMGNYFKKLVSIVLSGENADFYKNLFLSMDYQGSDKMTSRFVKADKKEPVKQEQGEKQLEQMFQLIDQSKLLITEQHEFNLLLQTLMILAFASISDGYRQMSIDPEYDSQKTIDDLNTKIQWLKHGVYK